LKIISIGNGKSETKTSTSSHCRINQIKKIKQEFNNVKSKIMNITGRLTRDAEVRTTSQEKQVVNFSVATNDSYRNKQGERIEQTTYFDCSYWITPNVARLLKKGTLVELSGRVSTRAWTGNDGEPRAGLNFHTSNIKLHGGSRKTETVQATAQAENNKATAQETEDDLPF
jgi:single-strand DNA-binding protein